VFSFLEEMLRDLPYDPPEYEAWSGDPKVLQERRWYLRFAPEKRAEIAKAYLGGAAGPQDQRVRPRLRATFPELLPQPRKDPVAIEPLIDRAISSGDFRGLPERAFTEEPWASRSVPASQAALRRACAQLRDLEPVAVFSSVQELTPKVRIPTRLLKLPSFWLIVTEERMACAKSLSDAQFLEIFSGESGKQRLSSVGHSKFGPTVYTELRQYLRERYQQLKAA
jgi:hypothetical protein